MNYLTFWYLAGAVVILSQLAQCQRNSTRGCRGRRCHRHDYGNVTTDTYEWTRTLDDNVVEESASVLPEKKIIVLYYNDSQLLNLNFTKSTTLFDFFNNVKFSVIKPRLRMYPCFLVETSQTFDKVLQELKKRNGTTVSYTAKRSLTALESPMTLEERELLFNQSTAISVQCKRRDILKAKEATGNAAADTKTLQMLELEGSLSFTIPAKFRNSVSRRDRRPSRGQRSRDETTTAKSTSR